MTVRRTTSSGRPRRPRGPKLVTVIQDLGTFGLGWGVIYQQALQDREPSWPVLLVVATLLGAPLGSEVLTRLRGTGGSGLDSPPPPSSPSSSPSGSGEDDR